MKYSKLFGKTTHGDRAGSKMVGNQLLIRAGYIRESTAGRYFFLPLGWRVHEKIKKIIKVEMDKAGAQEMISPVLHPLDLWRETNRTSTAGFELMKITDRRGGEFALGGTAEEMFVDVVRGFQLSHKDLPFNVYQFSTKFRDELRARGGLLRVREFVMKDAYSFDIDEVSFKKEYDKMAEVYTTVFANMGLTTYKVDADNGYIGGEYCHEFQVAHPEGEGRFFVSEDSTYVAHEDVATFDLEPMNPDEKMLPREEVDAIRGTTMEDGVKLHGLPAWKQMKDVLFADSKGKLYLAIARGDLDVNKTKLEKLLKLTGQLESATVEQIREIGSEPGFISPVGLENKVTIIADLSIRTVINFYGGANALHKDALNINIDRDFVPHVEADIAMAQEGFAKNGSKLSEKRGIEVGNIFQLGLHYSSLMKGATFIDRDGKAKPYYMGCYGIGIGRTMATIAEIYHDEKGLTWPTQVAPFDVHMISLSGTENEAADLYDQLNALGIEVLWDDRDISPGAKFADADLIGNPLRLVLSKRNEGKIEWKKRNSDTIELLDVATVLEKIVVEVK